jgi:ribosome-binding protein aMBF1 (putative translation factor)
MPMAQTSCQAIDCRHVELDGVCYVILRESDFESLCQKAGIRQNRGIQNHPIEEGLGLDRASLAEKLVRRRHAAGLSQAELARRAGVRPETLNRIERGRTTPDFATVRKLVVAMDAAERERATSSFNQSSHQSISTEETDHAGESPSVE